MTRRITLNAFINNQEIEMIMYSQQKGHGLPKRAKTGQMRLAKTMLRIQRLRHPTQHRFAFDKVRDIPIAKFSFMDYRAPSRFHALVGECFTPLSR
jgi:hypothetical protein